MTEQQSSWRVYVPGEEVVVFHKTREEWGELSNMAAGFPLVVAGSEWMTSEALYQACRFPHLPHVQMLIQEQSSPMAAKMKSKPFRPQSRPDWERVRVRVMRWVLRVKLAQNFDSFSAALQATGDRAIVERSHKDRYWGSVPDEEGNLCGQNVLGRLLMELRSELDSQPMHELLLVRKPEIEGLELFGRSVESVHADDQPDEPSKLF